MNSTKINIEKHLAEYCIGKWGVDFTEPITFPSHSDIYFTVYDLLMKRPSNVQIDEGNLEIKIPTRSENSEDYCRKNPEVYNYISLCGCKIINRKIENLFWAELHTTIDEWRHRPDADEVTNKYIEIVHYFMCRYRIESISEDALLKNYYRWKETLRQKNTRGYCKNKMLNKVK